MARVYGSGSGFELSENDGCLLSGRLYVVQRFRVVWSELGFRLQALGRRAWGEGLAALRPPNPPPWRAFALQPPCAVSTSPPSPEPYTLNPKPHRSIIIMLPANVT